MWFWSVCYFLPVDISCCSLSSCHYLPEDQYIYTGYPHSVLTFTNNPCLSLIESFHWNYCMSVYVFFIQNDLWLLLCGTVCSDYKLLNSTSSQINPVTCIVHTPSLLTSLNLRWDLCKYKFTNQNECQVNIFCCIKDNDQIWVFLRQTEIYHWEDRLSLWRICQ